MLHIQREQFTPRRAKFYAAEVLLALEFLHRNGIIYRYIVIGLALASLLTFGPLAISNWTTSF